MSDRITEADRELARAVASIPPEVPTPDYDEIMEKSYAIAMERIERKKSAKKSRFNRSIRCGLVAVSAACLLIIASTIFSIMAPVSTANADSWFDRVVISLKNAFRVETTPEIVSEAPLIEPREYVSIADARADGYTGYVPEELPSGYSVDNISIAYNGMSVNAVFFLSKSDEFVIINYQTGNNIQSDTIVKDADMSEPFEWNGFNGIISTFGERQIVVNCVNVYTDELINVSGQISPDEAKKVVMSMKKTGGTL